MHEEITVADMKVGIGGHTVGHVIHNTVSSRHKLKLAELRGCPVNRNTPTVMSRTSFIKMCLKFQEDAGKIDSHGKLRTSKVVGGHFSTSNHNLCLNCKIGEKVRKGDTDFEPPRAITFKDLVPQKPACKKKLEKEDVIKIRDRYAKGEKISVIALDYSFVTIRTIQRVCKGDTWKNV